MTINNIKTFTDNLWDWSILKDCFGQTSIAPTDIDALVERKGQFLLIEAKSIGKAVPTGQRIIFDALRKQKIFTIIVVWGNVNQPSQLQLFTEKFVSPVINCTLDDFKEAVSLWFAEADKRKSIDYKQYF